VILVTTYERKAMKIFLLLVPIWIVVFIGWVLNVIAVISAAVDPSFLVSDMTVMFVLRVIGIFFAPLGAILGYV
jgi:hypothetical protein